MATVIELPIQTYEGISIRTGVRAAATSAC